MRSILTFLPLVALLFSATGLRGQQPKPAAAVKPNTDFVIKEIKPALVDLPNYSSISGYDKRVSGRAKSWLEVEVTFGWEPRARDPQYAEELVFAYYILLNNKPLTKDRVPTLLTGKVTHMSVPQGNGMHSVVYVSSRTLEKFFDGKPPGISSLLIDAGVTITCGGQVVAASSWKSQKNGWWAESKQGTATAGFVLNKSETPFAPLAWDYYEEVKPKSGE